MADGKLQLEYLLPGHSIFSEVTFAPNTTSGTSTLNPTSPFKSTVAATSGQLSHHPVISGGLGFGGTQHLQPHLPHSNSTSHHHLHHAGGGGGSGLLITSYPETPATHGGDGTPTTSHQVVTEEAAVGDVDDTISSTIDTDDIEFAPTADGELLVGCRKCGVSYGSSTEMKLHFGSVHSRQTFECCVCNKLFLRRHGFLVHIKRYHEDVMSKSFPCPFCENKVFTAREALDNHISEQHRVVHPICPLCQKQVVDLKRHVQKSHTMLVSASDVQHDAIDNSAQAQQNQLQALDNPQPSQVARANMPKVLGEVSEDIATAASQVMAIHWADQQLTYVGGPEATTGSALPTQPLETGSAANLVQPMTTEPNMAASSMQLSYSKQPSSKSKKKRKWPREKSHHCSQCPYETNRAERLRVHISGVHNDERAFSCNMCDRKFKQKDKLTRHVGSVHMQDKPFGCDYCPMTFSRKDELHRHTSIVHSDEKSTYRPKMPAASNSLTPSGSCTNQSNEAYFECQECDFRCDNEAKLKLHLITVHEDSRPHGCNFCEKRFKLKDKLNLHLNMVHLRKKPFHCQYCNQNFGRKDAAKRHETKWCAMRPRFQDPDRGYRDSGNSSNAGENASGSDGKENGSGLFNQSKLAKDGSDDPGPSSEIHHSSGQIKHEAVVEVEVVK